MNRKDAELIQYRIPEGFQDEQAAPLLCAGVVGYRALRLAEVEDGQTLRLVGKGHGQAGEYGHGDLLIGRRAPAEIFPLILDWLERHAR